MLLIVGVLMALPAGASAAPANDDFAAAQVLSGLPASASGTNAGATKEAGEPDHASFPGGSSVWYSWTAPSSGPVTVDTCESDFDTVLAVYTGSAVNSLTAVTSNDDACGLGSQVNFQATAGTTYRIAVDSAYDFVQGNITLRLGPPPQCSDGADNDGDGLTDFPTDPGCTTSSDNDETNAPLPPPGPPGPPVVLPVPSPQPRPAGGSSVESGRYAGKTSQGKRIRFTVSANGKRITGLRFDVRFRCRDRRVRYRASAGLRQDSRDVIKLRDDKFRFGVRFRPGGGERWSVKISGRHEDGEFEGKLRVRESGPYSRPTGTRFRCDTGTVRWKVS